MPRDSQGLYSLPAGNPVVPGTLIESQWANPTMSDIGQALTDSLPRDGSAPMTGPLSLALGNPTQPRHATSKSYVDQFMAYATGLPIGAIVAYAAGSAPGGFLLCDGSAVSRTTYAQLFALIGTTYGSGDNATTFNLPDLRDQFIRGRDPVNRQVGSAQADAIKLHQHPVTDPGHSHTATNPAHTHTITALPHSHTASQSGHNHVITTGSHTHTINDPGHAHTVYVSAPGAQKDGGDNYTVPSSGSQSTSTNATGISINAVGNLGGSTDTQTPNVSVANADLNITAASTAQATTVNLATTGLTVSAFGDSETRPKNIAMDYYIKAIQDSVGPSGQVLGILTSDPNMIDIDSSNPVYPELVIKSNIAQGIPKLDSNGKIPTSMLPAASQAFLGVFDCSGGENPSEKYPTQTFNNGDTYLVAVAGTILVYDPVTYTSAMTLCDIGTNLVYISNGIDPVGWYLLEPSSAGVIAANVGFTPTAEITSTNVQAAIEEVNGNISSLAIAYAIALG